ncbi:MAG: cell division protein ZapA [Clostridium sp.]
MNRITVIIDDVEYNLKGNEDEGYLHRVALYVDKRIRNIKSKNEKLSISSASVLTAVNIADDMLKSQEVYTELLNSYKLLEEQQSDIKKQRDSLKSYVEELESKNQQLNLKLKDAMNSDEIKSKTEEIKRELEVVRIEFQSLKDKSDKEIKSLQEKNYILEQEKEDIEKNATISKEEEREKKICEYEEEILNTREIYDNKIALVKREQENLINHIKEEEKVNLTKCLEEKEREIKLIEEAYNNHTNKFNQEHRQVLEDTLNDYNRRISVLKSEVNHMEGEAKKYKTLYDNNKEQGNSSKFQVQNYKFKVLELENKISEQSIELAREKKMRHALIKK